MFKRKKTIASIMSSFTKQVSELKALSTAQRAEGDRLGSEALDLMAASEAAHEQSMDAFAEANKADALAAKIEDFIDA